MVNNQKVKVKHRFVKNKLSHRKHTVLLVSTFPFQRGSERDTYDGTGNCKLPHLKIIK